MERVREPREGDIAGAGAEPAGRDSPPPAAARRPDSVSRRLHPAVQVGWALRAAFNGFLLAIGATLAASFLVERFPGLPLRPALLGPVLSVAFVSLGLAHARRLFATWSYAVRPDEVVASYGVVWRVTRSIPRVRVQHVDVSSGPVDRALGLAHVSLHVAGSLGPVLTIPGLAPADAEAIREALLESARAS
jgi:membrane protein YdbS with pleckstrin-like domain